MGFVPWIAFASMVAASPPASPDLEAEVAAIFEDRCTFCHDSTGDPDDPEGINLEVEPSALVGQPSAATGEPLVVPGDPQASYLMDKLLGTEGIAGDPMPLDEDPLPQEQLDTIASWVRGLDPKQPVPAGDGAREQPDAGQELQAREHGRPAFHGTHQNVLPTTTTLGRQTLQYRIDHRFGRIGTERGAFGLDAGVVMSMGLAYGILDGWDVRLRRSNSRKDWELGTKYVPLRQEAGMPLSLGAYASVEYLRDFDVANEWAGNLMLMVSRLWFSRWSTMLTFGYHFDTNHQSRVIVDLGDGPTAVKDDRDTVTVGVASTVWVDKRKRWGIDLEYVLPIPDGQQPNMFYYRGGDATSGDMNPIGSWTLGGSLRAGKHFFQVFFTNNREIHTNLAAPGGHSDNPFQTPGQDSDNPFHDFNFFLGFNLSRKFDL